MGLLGWVVLGAVAGWLASIVTKRNSRMGCLSNIVVGVLGAVIGGFLLNLITGGDFAITFSWLSLLVAVAGAVILLFILGLITGRK